MDPLFVEVVRRESSVYKHRYARRNITIIQHSVRCSSSSITVLSDCHAFLSHHHFYSLCSLLYFANMDLIVRQVKLLGMLSGVKL